MSEHTRWIHLCPFHESLLSYLSPLHQLRSKIPLIGMTVMPIQLSIGARIGFGVGPLKDGLIVGRRAALSDEAQSDDHGTIGDLIYCYYCPYVPRLGVYNKGREQAKLSCHIIPS